MNCFSLTLRIQGYQAHLYDQTFPLQNEPLSAACLQSLDVLHTGIPLQYLSTRSGGSHASLHSHPKILNDGCLSKNSNTELVAVAKYPSATWNLEGLWPLLSSSALGKTQSCISWTTALGHRLSPQKECVPTHVPRMPTAGLLALENNVFYAFVSCLWLDLFKDMKITRY